MERWDVPLDYPFTVQLEWLQRDSMLAVAGTDRGFYLGQRCLYPAPGGLIGSVSPTLPLLLGPVSPPTLLPLEGHIFLYPL